MRPLAKVPSTSLISGIFFCLRQMAPRRKEGIEAIPAINVRRPANGTEPTRGDSCL